MDSERGQGTVEWVGLVLLVSAMMLVTVAVGVRVPGATLARALADRLLCAASLADGCGDEPSLIAAYGTDVGKLVRQHMPMLAFERGSTAVPVDFRRCRLSAMQRRGGGGPNSKDGRGTAGYGLRPRRSTAARGRRSGPKHRRTDCSGDRAGSLYVQYWTYYADSATLRGVPIAGKKGYHDDDWESVQLRFRPDDSVDQRASSHHGYNYFLSDANWMSDAGIASHDGWGPETHLLLVSGGSHAGNAVGTANIDRFTPGRRVHLVPLEQIAPESDAQFAVSPPWLKRVWSDPEWQGTD